MKKITLILMVFMVFSASFVMADVTSKVDQLIGTNQARLERTYYPRDMRPNQISLNFGPPLYTGLSYSYNIDQTFAVGIGAGTTYSGIATGLEVKAYILPNTVAPYVAAGIVYYSNFVDSNIIAGEASAGIDFALDNALGFNLGFAYVRPLSSVGVPFQSWSFLNDTMNVFSIQAGLSYRFR